MCSIIQTIHFNIPTSLKCFKNITEMHVIVFPFFHRAIVSQTSKYIYNKFSYVLISWLLINTRGHKFKSKQWTGVINGLLLTFDTDEFFL